MMLKKHSRITAILFSLILSVIMLCSSAVTVFAEESQGETFESYVIANNVNVLLVEAGVIPEGANIADMMPAVDQDKLDAVKYLVEEVVGVATEGVYPEGTKNYYISTYTDEYIVENFEPKRESEVISKRNSALSACSFTGESLTNESYKDYFTVLKIAIQADFEDIDAIAVIDAEEFSQRKKAAVEEVKTAYDKRLEEVESDCTAYLQSAYDSYVKTEGESIAFITDVTYQAKSVGECDATLTALKEEAILAIKSSPKNLIEVAMIDYNDWLNIVSGDSTAEGYTESVTQAGEKLKASAKVAINKYERDIATYQSYSGDVKLLQAFLEGLESDPLWTPELVSSISDKHRVITITAKDRNGNVIEAIPANCVLNLYQTQNGAAKRNATLALQEMDKELGVAYFIHIRITKGVHDYKLDEIVKIGEQNVKVTYEVRFDINKYYEKYLKVDNKKDLKENIADAASHIEGSKAEEKPLLCYGYKSGLANLIALSNIKLEGDVLVFTTDSHLNSFLLAGTNLESYLTSPLFWVIVVAAIILLIIVAKILAKHIKYAIRFNTNGGSYVEPVRAAKGEYFVLPSAPTKDGYVFAGWFTDKDLKVRFIGNRMTRRRGFKLHAKWVAPVSRERLLKFYDILRDTMCSYKKESFKSLLGLTETEFIASMTMRENYLQLNLAINPDLLRKEGITVTASKEKRYAEVPTQINISTEELFAQALELTKRVLVNKGLQPIDDYVPAPPSTEEERMRGFAFIIHNERVASTAEDYFELLRIAVKSYVLEEDGGKFKPGDKVTLARIYITNEVACLHLPQVKGEKGLKGSRGAQFADTPVLVKILAPRDMLEAYALIDKVMKANGFVKHPENANDLMDVKVPATNGFAYTLVF